MFNGRQRFGKQVPSEMNTHATTEEPPFLRNGEVHNREIVKKTVFSVGAFPRLYDDLTQLRGEFRESLTTAVEDDINDMARKVLACDLKTLYVDCIAELLYD
jgi:hypothetical protein